MLAGGYDVIVDGIGYILDRSTTSDPVQKERVPPPLPQGVPAVENPFSARDTDPPYPLEFNDWRGGAGQKLLDIENPAFNAYNDSRHITVQEQGTFELGPGSLFPYYQTADAKILAKAVLADKLWVAFQQNVAGDQIRRLTTFSTHSDNATYHLGDTTSTTFVPYADAASITVGSYLYCPAHGEMCLVTGNTGVALAVTRASCGTTAAAHDLGETWTVFRFDKAAWSGTAASDPVSAMATDGEKVYAATHSPGTATGKVYVGTAAGSETADWTSYSDATGIIDLAYSGGVLYGVQRGYSPSTLKVGYFSAASPAVFTAIAGDAVLFPNVESKGLAVVNNWVYWLVNGSNQAWVYRAQHSTSDSFTLACELPEGFHATCIKGYLGDVFIGGYTDTGLTYVTDADHNRIEGTLYIMASDATLRKVCTLDADDIDCTIRALTAYNRFLYMLTTESIWRYDLENGSYHHYADVPAKTGTVTGTGLSWTVDWEADPLGTQELPNTSKFTLTANAGANLKTEWEAGIGSISNFIGLKLTVDPKHHYAMYYKDDANLGAGTLEAHVGEFYSQAGMLGIADAARCALVKMRGVVTGSGAVNQFIISLGKWDVVSTNVVWTNYTYAGGIAEYTLRLTLDTSGARLYVNNAFVGSVAYDDLPAVDDSKAWRHSKRAWYAVGWPADTSATDNLAESISYSFMRYSNAGAYPPGYVPGTTLTASDTIAVQSGIVYVPLPDYYLMVCDPMLMAAEGWLETSASTLKQGTKLKQFSTVDVVHTPLASGQTLTAEVDVDGGVAGLLSVPGPTTADTSTVTVNAQGRRISTKVTLADTVRWRAVALRTHVTDITEYFTPLPQGATYTFVFNCSNRATLRNGQPYDIATDLAIAHLSDSVGKTVDVESIYGSFSGYVAAFNELATTSDITRGDRERGRVQVVIRDMSVGGEA